MVHKTTEELQRLVTDAQKKVRIKGTYSHYKRPHETYRVLHIGIVEADDSLCVVYQADYGAKLVFTRPLSSWLDQVSWQGNFVARFKLIDSSC